jgi:hypothetical protein
VKSLRENPGGQQHRRKSLERLRTNCQGRTGVFQFYITGGVAQSVVTTITKVVLTLNMVVMYLRETIFCNRTVHVGLGCRNGDGETLHEGLRLGKHVWAQNKVANFAAAASFRWLSSLECSMVSTSVESYKLCSVSASSRI